MALLLGASILTGCGKENGSASEAAAQDQTIEFVKKLFSTQLVIEQTKNTIDCIIQNLCL